MESLKVKDLREIARSRGLKGWYRLRKSELISLITSKEAERQQRELEEAERRQRELKEAETQIERRRQERLEKVTAEANTKATKKAKSKARRQAKREEAKREAERRAEVKRAETNQRKQRQENITGERSETKETKSQRKQRKRLERQAKQTETQRKANEQAQKKKKPKKERKQAKRQHRATKKESRQKLNALQRQRLTEPARPQLVSNVLEGNVQRWFVSGEGYRDPSVFLDHTEEEVKETIDSVNGPGKVYTSLKCKLKKIDLKTGKETHADFTGRSKTHTITTQIGDIYEEMKQKMLESLAKFQREGSGWQLRSIEGLDISVVKFNPLSGSGYSKLPKHISDKKAVINMRNDKCEEGKKISECECEKCEESKMCFKWAVTRALNPVDDNPQRITKELREQAEKYNWEGITFPTKVKDIPIWEKNNNIHINVYGYDGDSKKIYVIKMCDERTNIILNVNEDEIQDDKFINLFLHDDNHYCVVKNLSTLVSSQHSKHKEKIYFCLKCQNGFNTSEILKNHQEACLTHKIQTDVYPNPGEFTKFRNYERLHDVPFAVYADFECFVEPIQYAEQDPSKPFTIKYQNHTPSGFCYVIKCMDEIVYPTKTVLQSASYEGESMGEAFNNSITEDLGPIYEILKTPTPIIMTESDEVQHELAKECYICKDIFGRTWLNKNTEKIEEVKKCADHCHITGEYRGAACNKCNLRMRVPKFVPVFFHNLEGYDSHLFVKSLGMTEGDIKCIPKTDEKYISFSKNILMETEIITTIDKNGKKKEKEKKHYLEMRFLDSLKFMKDSLDSLAKTLGEDQFETLTSQMSLELLKKKGVFPYEYMTDFSKLNVTSLPPKDAFYSKLNKSKISDEEYEHAQKVWETFDCKTMRDYHDLYFKTVVLLLADIVTEFRRVCKRVYGLDVLHYYTAPGLAWDAMLKYTKIKLDLISDPDMYQMIEREGIRGEIRTIMKRYAKANHRNLKDYDPQKPSVFIEYLDANNLYGWAMSKPLPYRNFEWMCENDLESWRYKPCILEVDLEYPKELHDLHGEYPLAPERLLISKVKKLVPNLYDKTKYVVHHETLKQYLELGMKITKIHRGISFEEKKFMKPYIDLNTELRKKGTTDFEKDFYKLMNNSVFGKTMENVRNRVNVKLVTNKLSLNKLVKKSNYVRVNEFHENLVAVHMEKTTNKVCKPIYIGMSILDLSKTLMYSFHYDYVKPKWGNKAALLFTDTDSLCYEIQTDDFHEDIKDDAPEWFDTSNYEKEHYLYSERNKKQVGFMKDECGGNDILEFVGLRPKSYVYEVNRLRDNNGKWGYDVQKKKCKGIRKCVIKKEISIDDYRECLFSKQSQLRTMNAIRSRQHNIGTERINKTALSAYDDKRIVSEDGINTLPYGYKGDSDVIN